MAFRDEFSAGMIAEYGARSEANPAGVIEADMLKMADGMEPGLLALENTSEWTDLTLANGWAWAGGTYQTPQYKKVGGRVYFRGCVSGASASSDTIVTAMPDGYRASGFQCWPVYDGSTTIRPLIAGSAGQIYTGANRALMYLDVMGYEAAPLLAGWTDLSLSGSWVWQGTGYATPQYKKVGNRVYLKGNIKSGATTELFILPGGYRPAATQAWSSWVANASSHAVTITSAGVATVSTLRAYVYLDTISFEVA